MKTLEVLTPQITFAGIDANRLQEIIRPDTELNRELVNLLHEIFVYDPARRITAEQALRHRYFTIPSEPPPARR
jgi:serine/threonine protein kinase